MKNKNPQDEPYQAPFEQFIVAESKESQPFQFNLLSVRPVDVESQELEAYKGLISGHVGKFAKKGASSDGVSTTGMNAFDAASEFGKIFGFKGSVNYAMINSIQNSSIGHLFNRRHEIYGQNSRNDNIILFSPSYGNYARMANESGMKYHHFETKKEQNYEINIEDLKKWLDNFQVKPKFMLICYPNNPTGLPLKEEAAKGLLEIAKKNEMLIISDEIFMFSGKNIKNDEKDPLKMKLGSNCSIASLPEFEKNAVIFTSFSKSLGNGVGVGVVIGNKDVVDSISANNAVSGVNQATLIGVLSNMNKGRYVGYLQKANEIYARNEDCFEYACNKISEFLNNPNSVKRLIDKQNQEYGAFFLFDFSELKGLYLGQEKIENDFDLMKFLNAEASIGLVPGQCSFFKPEEMIMRAATGYSEINTIIVSKLLVKAVEIFCQKEKCSNEELELKRDKFKNEQKELIFAIEKAKGAIIDLNVCNVINHRYIDRQNKRIVEIKNTNDAVEFFRNFVGDGFTDATCFEGVASHKDELIRLKSGYARSNSLIMPDLMKKAVEIFTNAEIVEKYEKFLGANNRDENFINSIKGDLIKQKKEFKDAKKEILKRSEDDIYLSDSSISSDRSSGSLDSLMNSYEMPKPQNPRIRAISESEKGGEIFAKGRSRSSSYAGENFARENSSEQATQTDLPAKSISLPSSSPSPSPSKDNTKITVDKNGKTCHETLV